MTVPMAIDSYGMPVGIEFVGRCYDEVMNRMNAYLGEFEAHGTDHISVDME